MIAGLVSAGLLLILLTTITPAKAGAFGILAVFFLSYVFILTVTTFLLWGVAYLTDKIARSGRRVPRKLHAINLKRAYLFATVIALGPIILVGLHSVGGIGVYDVGLVLLFMALGCVYVARRSA